MHLLPFDELTDAFDFISEYFETHDQSVFDLLFVNKSKIVFGFSNKGLLVFSLLFWLYSCSLHRANNIVATS